VATRAVGAGGIQISPAFVMTDADVDELAAAIDSRRPAAGAIIHSDQGVQRRVVGLHRPGQSGLVPSMGGVGDCFDNSMIEAFWSRMQVELLDRQSWRPRCTR
jgi:transposase InsO family protein